MAKFYAWATLYNGGETKKVGDRTIIVSRNVVEPGSEVSKTKLKVTDEEWAALVDGGSVRPYPFPKMPESFSGSPSEFVMSQLRKGEEEIDPNVILGLAMTSVVEEDAGPSELAEANE